VFTTQGYQFETHKIVTEDGYILTCWRVPGKTNESSEEMMKRKPIVLSHGLMDNSGTWVVPEF
jgi:pimeloyl-ACP methyl ester carboxylesterase